MPWDPSQYALFTDHRLRPALDLLARVEAATPRTVVDLGCGAGNVTRLLAKRWPRAHVIGIDSSLEMLDRARARSPADGSGRTGSEESAEPAAESSAAIDWHQSDIAAWTPAEPVDVVYSNAALHWLPDHASLFPRLVSAVAEGGTLAIQVPRNWSEPSHAVMAEIEAMPRWRERLAGIVRPHSEAPDVYWSVLAPLVRRLDVWETTYVQALTGEDAVAQWTRGTLLVPYLEALPAAEHTDFEAEYRRRVARAYPRRPDGITLYPFRRVFVVAVR